MTMNRALRHLTYRWDDLITARLAHIATLYSKWSAVRPTRASIRWSKWS